MNRDFPRVLCLLRKEQGVSQKKAAEALGVSQALLSHYEKGIRECGLDFLVRCANYYGVSCDYLLGRSPDRTGSTLTVEDLPDMDAQQRERIGKGGVLPVLSRRLVCNSVTVLFDLLARADCKSLTKEVASYLMLAVYKMYRLVHSSNPKNQTSTFAVPVQLAQPYASAAMEIAAANVGAIAAGSPPPHLDAKLHPELLVITGESLSEEYPQYVSSLLNLVQNAESTIGFQPAKP